MRSDWILSPRANLLWVALIVLLAVGGCVRVDVGNRMPTIGEQLVDLYEAHASGVISDDEFRSLKSKLLRSLQI